MEFNTWFGNLQTILDSDVAAKLAEDILELQNRFGVLAREYCIYQGIEPNPDEPTYDSDDIATDEELEDVLTDIFG